APDVDAEADTRDGHRAHDAEDDPAEDAAVVVAEDHRGGDPERGKGGHDDPDRLPVERRPLDALERSAGVPRLRHLPLLRHRRRRSPALAREQPAGPWTSGRDSEADED